MIHQFNAMVRRLRVLIEEYEERGKQAQRNPEDYFLAMLKNEMTPQEVAQQFREFFAERYTLMGFIVEDYPEGKNEKECARILTDCFERNPRFAARCMLYMENTSFFMVYYRISEEDYIPRVTGLWGIFNRGFGGEREEMPAFSLWRGGYFLS